VEEPASSYETTTGADYTGYDDGSYGEPSLTEDSLHAVDNHKPRPPLRHEHPIRPVDPTPAPTPLPANSYDEGEYGGGYVPDVDGSDGFGADTDGDDGVLAGVEGVAVVGASSTDSQRQALVKCGQALYNDRAKEHYTEGPERWQGITAKIRPPSAPTYSDCSSAVSWCYWTVFGNGPDILNGESWSGGYTGTMATHGKAIPCNQMQPGDVALYGSGAPWDHAEMYMGGGKMVSHGADPVSYQSSTSLQGFASMQCRRYF